MDKKNILVTGAAGGIGLACARMCLAEGHNVTAFDVQGDLMARELAGHGAELTLVPGDVSDPATCTGTVKTAVETYGHLDALIHFAAAHSTAPWDQLDAAEWARVMAINVTGAFLMCQAAANHMVDRGKGAIVLTASGVILSGGAGGNGRGGPAYASSKGAIIALNRSLARSLGPHGVRVNTISPGNVETPMIAEYSDEVRQASINRAVLGRIAEPDELASVALFLISDKASFITGENVNVNGGASFS